MTVAASVRRVVVHSDYLEDISVGIFSDPISKSGILRTNFEQSLSEESTSKIGFEFIDASGSIEPCSNGLNWEIGED